MSEPLVAIIGGTGASFLGKNAARASQPTPWGGVEYARLTWDERQVLFLPRHGFSHSLPPHRVDYRALVWALHSLGAREIIATHAVGTLDYDLPPGAFLLVDQFLDFTRARASTFFPGGDGPVLHADVTDPCCPRLVAALSRAGAILQHRLHAGGVYACMEGPRFETAAEIRALRILGARVVGMTAVPEAFLAREAGICYSSLALVSNWAAGMSDSPLQAGEVHDVLHERESDLHHLLAGYLAQSGPSASCSCRQRGFPTHLPTMPSGGA